MYPRKSAPAKPSGLSQVTTASFESIESIGDDPLDPAALEAFEQLLEEVQAKNIIVPHTIITEAKLLIEETIANFQDRLSRAEGYLQKIDTTKTASSIIEQFRNTINILCTLIIHLQNQLPLFQSGFTKSFEYYAIMSNVLIKNLQEFIANDAKYYVRNLKPIIGEYQGLIEGLEYTLEPLREKTSNPFETCAEENFIPLRPRSFSFSKDSSAPQPARQVSSCSF